MNRNLLCVLSSLIMLSNVNTCLANPDEFLGPRDRQTLKVEIEGYIKHNDSIFQYGNWYAPWSGGARNDDKTDNKLPVDSLDAIAQKHDFAYQIAEQQGKIYGFAEEKRLKAIADYLAVRDAKALAENPKDWLLPATDPIKAARYRDRMITGFSYEAQTYDAVVAVSKGLNWATSPIESWAMDKSLQLDATDLEKQINILQKDWNSKHFPPIARPEQPVITPQDNKTPVTIDKNKPENTNNTTSTETTHKQNDYAQSTTSQADTKELKNDPDYIELMHLTNKMMSLANTVMVHAKQGKVPNTDTVNQITDLQSKISTLNKRIEEKYAKKLNQQQREHKNNTSKIPENNKNTPAEILNKAQNNK